MLETTLIEQFDTLAAVTRIRSNSVQTKLASILNDAVIAKEKIVKITAIQLDVEKIHIQTLYNALRKNNVEVKRGQTFVVKNVDSHYFNEVIVKLQ